MKAVRLLLYILVPLVVVVVVATMMAGSIIREGIESEGPAVLGADVSVESISFSLIGGSASISGLEIGTPEGFKAPHTFKLGSVDMRLDPMSVFGDEVIIHSVEIVEPDIVYEITGKGSNLDRISENAAAALPAEDASEPSEELLIVIEDLRIVDAKVTVQQSIIGKAAQTVTLPEIHLTDIGRKGAGVQASDAAKQILAAVTAAARKQVTSGQVKGLIEGAGDALPKDVGGKIKGLFGGSK